MKKAFMLVAVIAMLAAPVFAEVEVTISGEATTSFGFDLDTKDYGLLSEVSSDVALAIGSLDGESMGEGSWYGVIELTGAALSWDTSNDEALGYEQYEWDSDLEIWVTNGVQPELFVITAPDVAAKITNGNVYVMLQTEADFDADYVDGVDNDAMEFTAADVSGSLTLGGTFAPVTFAAEVATAGDYDGNAAKGVALGANLGLDLAPIMVDIAWAGAFGYATAQEMGFAVKVAADLAPLSITAAFDGTLLSSVFTWEAGAAIAVDLAPLTIGLDGYFAAGDVDTKITVGYADDMFTADAFFGLYDLTATIAWETGVDVTVNITSGIAANAGWAFDSASMMSAYADVAFTELVDNVTFTLGWANAADMLDKDAAEANFGDIFVSAGIAF